MRTNYFCLNATLPKPGRSNMLPWSCQCTLSSFCRSMMKFGCEIVRCNSNTSEILPLFPENRQILLSLNVKRFTRYGNYYFIVILFEADGGESVRFNTAISVCFTVLTQLNNINYNNNNNIIYCLDLKSICSIVEDYWKFFCRLIT